MQIAAFDSSRVLSLIAILIASSWWAYYALSFRGAARAVTLTQHHNTGGGGSYVVLLSNNYGRYSNMRAAFINAAAFAAYTNRTLVYTPPMNCEPLVTWDDLMDTSALPMPALLATPHALLECPKRPPMLVNHEHLSCSSRYAIPKPDPGDRYLSALMEWSPIVSADGKMWTMDAASGKILGHRCAGILCAWDMFQADDSTRRMTDVVEKAMRPPPAIKREVDRFLASHGFGNGQGGASAAAMTMPFVGVHLRLTDIGGGATEDKQAGGCRLNMTDVALQVEDLQKRTNSTVVALATDDIASTCAKTLLSRFKAVHVKSGVWAEAACQEAVFVQEVLGHSAGFIGHSGSTFSYAVDGIRLKRYSAEHRGVYVSNMV